MSSMTRPVLVLALIALSACSSQAATEPSPSGRAPTACRLPLTQWQETGQSGGRYASSFLTYPSGDVTADAQGTFTWDAAHDAHGQYRSAIAPYLYGPGSTSYDRAASRWVPVGANWVEPDGSRYAYAEPFEGKLHLVTVRTGQDRIIPLPARQPYNVLRFLPEGIYLTLSWEGQSGGLFLVDLKEFRFATISDNLPVVAIQPGVAWLADVDDNDSARVQSHYTGGSLPDEILSRDLKTGTTTTWFYRQGKQVEWVGIDRGGHPIVLVSSEEGGPTESWRVGAASTATKIPVGSSLGTWMDNRGIWFANETGIFLLTTSDVVEHVSAQRGQPVGDCL